MKKIKEWFHWLYNWITVIVAGLVGVPSVILSLLSLIDGIDLTPFFPAEHALKIVTAVALAKAACAYIVSLIEARRAYDPAKKDPAE